jgi:hypothetical protein
MPAQPQFLTSTQAKTRRAQGSRSFRADLEALRADRDQALTQLLNA